MTLGRCPLRIFCSRKVAERLHRGLAPAGVGALGQEVGCWPDPCCPPPCCRLGALDGRHLAGPLLHTLPSLSLRLKDLQGPVTRVKKKKKKTLPGHARLSVAIECGKEVGCWLDERLPGQLLAGQLLDNHIF